VGCLRNTSQCLPYLKIIFDVLANRLLTEHMLALLQQFLLQQFVLLLNFAVFTITHDIRLRRFVETRDTRELSAADVGKLLQQHHIFFGLGVIGTFHTLIGFLRFLHHF